MRVHHIGYLVEDIESASTKFEQLGFSRLDNVIEDLELGIFVLFLNNRGYVIELIQPIDKASLVYGLLKKHKNSPYHICYETENIHSKVEEMVTGGGYMLIQQIQPSSGIPGCPNVAFLFSLHIGIIELVERI